MKSLALVVLTLPALLVLQMCPRKITANVGFNNLDKLQTSLGLINSSGVLLGNIVELDPVTKNVAGGTKLIFADADRTVQPGDATTDILDSTDLKISFSADVPSTVSAQLSSELANSTELNLKNSKRLQIDQVATVLNRNENLTALKTKFEHLTSGHRLLLVWAGNSAESVAFSLKKSSTNELNVNVPGTGKFNIQVNYTAQDALTKTLTPAAAQNWVSFFKVVEIVLNADGSLSYKPFDGNTADLNWSQAIM